MDPLATGQKLLEQGVLGVVLVLFVFLYLREIRENRKAIQRYEKFLREQAAQHKAEQDVLRERYITKAESWMAKYNENSMAQTNALAALANTLAEDRG